MRTVTVAGDGREGLGVFISSAVVLGFSHLIGTQESRQAKWSDHNFSVARR